MRYKITLSYDGTPFSGWQIQPNAPSIQESLQRVLGILLKEEITVTGAGRTDAGVHAVGYVAHFDGPDGLDTAALGYKLNAMLPREIAVHCVAVAAPDFHARFDAVERSYKYFIHRKADPFLDRYSWRCPFQLDINAMNEACRYLSGRRDFSCFEKVGGANKTSLCDVRFAGWKTYVPTHVAELGYPCEEGDFLVFEIRADRFLRNMVRAIVGTLVEIGRGRHEPAWMAEVLASGNRDAAGESVPGHALFLKEVDY